MAAETSEIQTQVEEARARLQQDLGQLDEITSRWPGGAKLQSLLLGSVLAVSLVAIAAVPIVKLERRRHRKPKHRLVGDLLRLLR
jgi:outer membrane protein TolC